MHRNDLSPEMFHYGGASGVVERQVAGSTEKAVVAHAKHPPELTNSISRGLVLRRVGGRTRPHSFHFS